MEEGNTAKRRRFMGGTLRMPALGRKTSLLLCNIGVGDSAEPGGMVCVWVGGSEEARNVPLCLFNLWAAWIRLQEERLGACKIMCKRMCTNV